MVFIRKIYNSVCVCDPLADEDDLSVQRAGVSNSNRYSQRVGSLAAINLFSRPQLSKTSTDLAGPKFD